MRFAFIAAAAVAFAVAPLAAAAGPHAGVRDLIAQSVPAPARITGKVTDSRGQALARAGVSIDGGGLRASTQTDDKGAFTFNVPAGFYSLTINRGGFQTAQTDVTVVDAPVMVNVSLVEADLANLRVIGRTSANAGRSATFNISSSAGSAVGFQTIQQHDIPDITQLGAELPGITIEQASNAPNKSFVVRGTDIESRVTIEGHPVSSGVFGTYFTQYAASGIFQSIDVLKGAGLNGPTAGQSAIGTVNLRTRDFSAKNSASLKIGSDSYYGGLIQAFADVNFLKDDRASLIVGRVVNGYNGPTKGYFANNLDFNNSPSFASSTLVGGQLPQGGLVNFVQDLSDTYTVDAELVKLRYKFSQATSLTLEYLGLQGRYDPQGGAYAQFEAFATIAQCTNRGVPGSGAQCTPASTYNAPWVQSSMVGQTNVPTYSYFPGSNVINNQPNFNAELRTTFKNDTLLVRPYTAVINRLINGNGEPTVPGNNGGWFEVLNSANCTVQFTAPTATAGASGPCFAANAANNTAAFVNNPQVPHSFPTNATPLVCTAAAPCFTTPTAANNAQIFGYGTPFNQPELDQLSGYTVTYIHPVGNNIFNLSFDHFMDDTTKFSGDTTPPPPGCLLVLRGGLVNPATGLGSQPACKTTNNILPATAINLPDTVITQSDLSLTAQLQLRPNLEFDFGNYFTFYKGQGQVEDPRLLGQFAAAGVNTNLAPLQLVTNTATYAHYDPHFGFVYRPSRDVSLRFTAGSSISTPFASQISGPGSLSVGATQDVFNVKNPSLLPEEVVAYDFGGDFRLAGGAVFSGDVYNNVIHNAWITNTFAIPNFAGRNPQLGTLETEIINGPEKRAQGIELSYTNLPARGWGVHLTSSFERSYFLQLPISFIAAAGSRGTTTFNGAQIPFIPYAKGYGEFQYAGAHDFLFRFGADYEGNNNASFFTPYVMFDASLRFGLGNGIVAQIAGENIGNLNFGNALGKAVFNQGVPSVTQFVTPSGQFGYSQVSNGIVGPPFKSFRFTLSKSF